MGSHWFTVARIIIVLLSGLLPPPQNRFPKGKCMYYSSSMHSPVIILEFAFDPISLGYIVFEKSPANGAKICNPKLPPLPWQPVT